MTGTTGTPPKGGGKEELNKTESPDSDSYGLGESSSSSSSDGRGLDLLGNDSSHYDGTSRREFDTPEQSVRDDHHNKEESNMFGRRRISNTFRWKLFVVILMLINTTFVITATSLFLKHEEQQEFERSFDSTAKTVVEAAQAKAKALQNSLELLGDLITAYTLDASGTEWPFVTLPHFEERVAPLRESSSSLEMLGFLPLVRTMQREWWEGYAVEQQGWILESHQLYEPATITNEQEMNNNSNQSSSSMSEALLPGASVQEWYSISPQISSFTGQQYESNPQRGPYAPLWQISPPPPFEETAMINTDLLLDETLRVLFESLLLQQEASNNATSVVVSTVLQRPIYSATTTPIMKSIGQDESTQQPTAATTGPRSVLLHPIHESYNHRGDIQAFAMGVFQWKDFFSELLPDELNGVDVVLYNPCRSSPTNEQESFHTFRIEGREATYLGPGDFHQAKHTKSCQEAVLTAFESRVKRENSTEPMASCNYELRVFPSEEYRVALKSNGPAIFTAVVAAVFLATGMVFWLYISLVGSRQNKVMALAMSTSVIVASLFPTAVRDQILQNAKEEVQLRKSDKSHKSSHLRGSSRLNASKRGRRASLSMSTKSQPPQRQGPPTTKPIANLFPEATVLFADIVGFTAWSSSREPTQGKPSQ